MSSWMRNFPLSLGFLFRCLISFGLGGGPHFLRHQIGSCLRPRDNLRRLGCFIVYFRVVLLVLYPRAGARKLGRSAEWLHFWFMAY